MKILIFLMLFISVSFGMEIINFSLTNNVIINQYLDIFLTFSIVYIPLVGAISLLGAK